MASPKVEMLQASINENEESHFRFIDDQNSIKYITISAGLYNVDDMAFAPVLLPRLLVFPLGDWNVGRISKNPNDGQPFFSEATRESLPGVQQNWYDTFIDYVDLTMCEKLRSNVWQVTSPQFKSPIIAKFARLPVGDAVPRSRNSRLPVDRWQRCWASIFRPSDRGRQSDRLPYRTDSECAPC